MYIHKDKLERNRGLLMQLSIIASLLIVLLLFENTTRSEEIETKTFTQIELDIEPQKEKTEIIPPVPGSEQNNSIEDQVIRSEANFPGGEKELKRYIAENMQYSVDAKRKNIQGRVIVKFNVSKKGKIKDPEVIRSIHPLLDTEALRLVKNMPDWQPEKINGKPVNTIQTLNVIFLNDANI